MSERAKDGDVHVADAPWLTRDAASGAVVRY
jgi:hypothetical protein